jgi:hypothetical protein
VAPCALAAADRLDFNTGWLGDCCLTLNLEAGEAPQLPQQGCAFLERGRGSWAAGSQSGGQPFPEPALFASATLHHVLSLGAERPGAGRPLGAPYLHAGPVHAKDCTRSRPVRQGQALNLSEADITPLILTTL